MAKYTPAQVALAVRNGALEVERGTWKACDDSGSLFYGWLVGAIFTGNDGLDYYARTAFADWWAPAVHRNDGLRTSETANDKGLRLGRGVVCNAMRRFAEHLERVEAA